MTTSTKVEHVQVSQGELVSAVVKLLAPYSDKNSPHLKESRFKGNVYNDTGIIVVRNYKGNSDHIEFKFFIDDPDRGKDLFVGFLFRMPDFLKDPKGYITGMLDNFGLSMHAYSTWRAENQHLFENRIQTQA